MTEKTQERGRDNKDGGGAGGRRQQAVTRYGHPADGDRARIHSLGDSIMTPGDHTQTHATRSPRISESRGSPAS